MRLYFRVGAGLKFCPPGQLQIGVETAGPQVTHFGLVSEELAE
jgi:hypothetical protein